MAGFHNKTSVLPLNEKHGYFQYADAQGDVSRAFADDAVASFISLGKEAVEVLGDTGKAPSQLAASLTDAQAEIARLRGALEEINRTTFDDDANRIAHSALQK